MADSFFSPIPGTESSPFARPSRTGAAPRSCPSALNTKTFASILSIIANGVPLLSPESTTQSATCLTSLDLYSQSKFARLGETTAAGCASPVIRTVAASRACDV